MTSPTSHERQRHYVSPRQLSQSQFALERQIGGFDAVAQDGRRHSWNELSRGKPVVLFFVKEGCPCNIEFAPFFDQLAFRFADVATFMDVIDADAGAARRFARGVGSSRLVLADKDRVIIDRLGVENGGYVVLLSPDGVIEGCWPGCSAEMLKDVAARIADVAGTPRDLEFPGAPGPLTTGCPYESKWKSEES